ncbi:MAG TPA: hypothetical protein VMV69_14905, partial [Pirellulales bacterium]|nr:hypothetical protein [Pirellulales bacterium]
SLRSTLRETKRFRNPSQRDPKERGVRRREARQLGAAFAARSDVMGYLEVVFFRFAAVLFLHVRFCATSVLFPGK